MHIYIANMPYVHNYHAAYKYTIQLTHARPTIHCIRLIQLHILNTNLQFNYSEYSKKITKLFLYIYSFLGKLFDSSTCVLLCWRRDT